MLRSVWLTATCPCLTALPNLTFCVMFTPSLYFSCEFQRLTFSTDYFRSSFLLLSSYSLPFVFIAPTPRWYISLSLLIYSLRPVIKELSSHSKLTLLFSLMWCRHWDSTPTYLLCPLLSVKSCWKETLEGHCEQDRRGEGNSSCFFLLALFNLQFLSLLLRGCFFTPAAESMLKFFRLL